MDQKQVTHMAYAPLGQGNRNEMYQEPAILSLAGKYGKTPAQILLGFLTQKQNQARINLRRISATPL